MSRASVALLALALASSVFGCSSGRPREGTDGGPLVTADGCVPACGARTCGPDPSCGVSCGSCSSGSCGADGTCSGGGPGAPSILSFTADHTSLSEGGRVTFTAIVTDPQGIDDLIGGMLVDGAVGGTYGAFATSAAEGAYSMTVDWNAVMGDLDSGLAPTARVFRARFYDAEGHSAEAELTISLTCGGAALLCQHTCVPSDVTHCGACDDACGTGGEGGPRYDCTDHVCVARTTQAPVVDALTATITTAMPTEGWGTGFRVDYTLTGHGLAGQQYLVTVGFHDGPSGFFYLGSDEHYVNADASGGFTTSGTVITDASDTSNGFTPRVGTFTLIGVAHDTLLDVEGTRTTTVQIPSCPGTRELLACGGAGSECLSYYRPEACGACDAVCGATRTVTNFPDTPSAATASVTSVCTHEPGCAFPVLSTTGQCSTACAASGLTCRIVWNRNSDTPTGELCTTYINTTRRCMCGV